MVENKRQIILNLVGVARVFNLGGEANRKSLALTSLKFSKEETFIETKIM